MTRFHCILVLLAVALGEPIDANGVPSDESLLRPLQRVVNKEGTCPACSCGLTNNNRIVGGEVSDVNKYPWVAMIFVGGRFTCGGSLINNKYVMTAAHCILSSKPTSYEVRFLQNRFDDPVANALVRQVSQVIKHAKYNSRSIENDIALLKLSEPVEFNEKIRPVCLPPATGSYAGQDAIVIGWGAKKENGQASEQLQEVTVPIITNKQCRDKGLKVSSGMLCAGLRQGGKDSCQGDSGGPLHVVSGSKLTQAGIVSWGIGCAGANRPGVYTKVSNYVSWIRRNTADACAC